MFPHRFRPSSRLLVRHLVPGAIAAALYCASALAQTAPAAPAAPAATTLSAEEAAHAVTSQVVVVDKHGNLIKNVTANDLVLTDDNHPQTIGSFTDGASLPLSMGLLMDTSVGQQRVLSDKRTAAEHFLDSILTDPKDKAFAIEFNREVDLLEDLTSSKDKLHKALDGLGTPQFGSQQSNDDSGDDSGRHRTGYGTTLYDAIYLASTEVLNKPQGRKALLLLTDGVDGGSKETLNSAVEAAERSNIAIYAIYFKGNESQSNNNSNPGTGRHGGMGGGFPGGGGGFPGGGGYPGGGGWPGGSGGSGRNPRPAQPSNVDGRKALEKICGRTGGYMFEAKKGKLDDFTGKIAEELRGEYILSYTPGADIRGEGFHRIGLTAKKKDWFVQTRDGYYGDQ